MKPVGEDDRSLSGGVVAGVDGSPEAGEALRYAAEWALLHQRPLVAIHAYRPPPTALLSDQGGLTAESSNSFRAAQTVLADALAGVALAPEQRLVARVEFGSAPRVLAVRARDAAAVVLGQHRFSIDDQALGGPVAPTLAAAASCPVVVVPRGWHARGGRPSRLPRPVVVGLDGRSEARPALDLAFKTAELTLRPVLAVHADTNAEGERSVTGREFGEFIADHAADYPDVIVATAVTSGKADDVLLEATQQASLLIVARPHRVGSEAWRHSMARSLIGRTLCPLAIIPPLSVLMDLTGHGVPGTSPSTHLPCSG